MKKIITTLVLFFALYNNQAQNIPSWIKYSNPSNFQNYDVKEVCTGVDSVGNIYTAATAMDTVNNRSKLMIVKYNAAGAQQWLTTYDNNDVTYNGTYVVAILVDKAGNSYVCGYGTHNSTNQKDFMVSKYDYLGIQVWMRYFDGGQNERDYVTCATFDKAGNIIVAGNVNFQGTNQYDIGVVKYTTSGTQVWSYVYNNAGSNGDDNAYGIAADPNNNIFVTGNSYGVSARDMITIKLNSSGANQWTKIVAHTSSGNDEFGYGVVADALGNCYATGSLSDWATIKYDPNGNVLWTNHRPASALNSFSVKKVMLDRADNVIIASDAFYTGGIFSELEVNKLNNATGTNIWTTHYNFGGIDNYSDARLDTSNNIYISGYFDGPLGKDASALILNPSGVAIWNATFTNTNLTIGTDRSCQMVLDNNQNVILVGTAERRGPSSQDAVDIYTMKYNALAVGIKINTLEQSQLSIYPNPCNELLNLSTTNKDLIGSSIVITNVIGQVVINDQLNGLDKTIAVNKLEKGIYFLNISNEKYSVSRKLIVE